MTTFQLKQAQSEGISRNENGFSQETKALTYHYKIEVFAMPKAKEWKEFTQNF